MNADIIALALAELDVIRKLADEWIFCLDEPDRYAFLEGITRPRGTTWTQWSEEHREILAADLAVRVGRLAALFGVTAGAA